MKLFAGSILNAKQKLLNLYRKRFVFVTSNILGILIAIIGIIVCIGMILGSYSLNSAAKTRTKNIEKVVNTYLDKGNNSLEEIKVTIANITSIDELVHNISDMSEKNIDRLESLKLSLSTLNYRNYLDRSITHVDETLKILKEIKKLPIVVLISKEIINEKIDMLKAKIRQIKIEIGNSASKVRQIAFYTFLVSFVLAGIFLVGEFTLLSRSIKGLKSINA
ncbi:MAG: hypothetical protein U0R17_00225 [Acidimicrobiia bacterium]